MGLYDRLSCGRGQGYISLFREKTGFVLLRLKNMSFHNWKVSGLNPSLTGVNRQESFEYHFVSLIKALHT